VASKHDSPDFHLPSSRDCKHAPPHLVTVLFLNRVCIDFGIKGGKKKKGKKEEHPRVESNIRGLMLLCPTDRNINFTNFL
jgi:hypothetical protein